ELENTLTDWTDELAYLRLLKGVLSGGVSADDLAVLQERNQLLQRQWDEIGHQLGLRRQQVNEKLNEWAIFNEKNKELCEWLTQMESKVSQNGDISIEEMINKLQKDYQEEIAMSQVNRQQLQQMGERLAKASHEGKATEIGNKLNKVNERWQHLLDLIGARVKKLHETLVAVQQLDKNMSSLRSWLSHMETQLSRPIVYETCDAEEIQRKLQQQQDLQKDIEKHSTGVSSVLNLCEVLLHDCDACSTEVECESIQQATRSLDRRWRSICATSMERRLKIEETGRLWQKFLDDFSRFEDWLKQAESTAAQPNSSGVLYTEAKEELKKFEAFQRQVHESLTQLELINKQYRRLARENRTDSSCHLRQMVHDGNQRWDNLQRRAASILRRLKHFVSQREEFETTRESILVWLTEMDLQLTNIEHFSECDIDAKLRQLRAFQQEISLHTPKIERVFHQGEVLIGKSEPMDAAVIEEELEELRRYCQEVFSHVERYYKKLTREPVTDDEHDVSDRELDLSASDLNCLPWSKHTDDNCTESVVGHAQVEPSGRDTPASMDSIPLEWDHDYDLSRGLEAEQGGGPEDDHEEFLHDTTALSDVVIPESPEAYLKLTENTLRSSTGEPNSLGIQSHYRLQQTEESVSHDTSKMDTSYLGYMRLLGDCRSSITTVKRVDSALNESDDEPGLICLNNTEPQTTGVIERWELAQAQGRKQQLQQNPYQWHQLCSDVDDMLEWLSQAEEELQQLRRLERSTDIYTIEQRVQKLKKLQKAMDNHKSMVLSINLTNTDLLETDTAESAELQELQSRVREMNGRWDQMNSSLVEWRQSLQDALMQCLHFHEMSHSLLLCLENIDRRRNKLMPVSSSSERNMLIQRQTALKRILVELLESQWMVALLEDMSSHLLVDTQGSDRMEAQERVHVVGNRHKLLLKEVKQDLGELKEMLQSSGYQQSSLDELDSSDSAAPLSAQTSLTRLQTPQGKWGLSQSGPSAGTQGLRSSRGAGSTFHRSKRCSSFMLRVLRAAFPFQLLLLLLLVLTRLVPATQEDYSCTMANNFARSFHPMLHYTNGPPPI
ncbi:hypothetical protein Z043_113860, partial [Scleropages formosus]